MTGAQFLKRVRQWAKDTDLARPEFIAKKGRGSHGPLFVGAREPTVKDRKKEIGKGLLNKMLADLGMDKTEFLRAGRSAAGSVRRNRGDQGASHRRRPRAHP